MVFTPCAGSWFWGRRGTEHILTSGPSVCIYIYMLACREQKSRKPSRKLFKVSEKKSCRSQRGILRILQSPKPIYHRCSWWHAPSIPRGVISFLRWNQGGYIYSAFEEKKTENTWQSIHPSVYGFFRSSSEECPRPCETCVFDTLATCVGPLWKESIL